MGVVEGASCDHPVPSCEDTVQVGHIKVTDDGTRQSAVDSMMGKAESCVYLLWKTYVKTHSSHLEVPNQHIFGTSSIGLSNSMGNGPGTIEVSQHEPNAKSLQHDDAVHVKNEPEQSREEVQDRFTIVEVAQVTSMMMYSIIVTIFHETHTKASTNIPGEQAEDDPMTESFVGARDSKHQCDVATQGHQSSSCYYGAPSVDAAGPGKIATVMTTVKWPTEVNGCYICASATHLLVSKGMRKSMPKSPGTCENANVQPALNGSTVKSDDFESGHPDKEPPDPATADEVYGPCNDNMGKHDSSQCTRKLVRVMLGSSYCIQKSAPSSLVMFSNNGFCDSSNQSPSPQDGYCSITDGTSDSLSPPVDKSCCHDETTLCWCYNEVSDFIDMPTYIIFIIVDDAIVTDCSHGESCIQSPDKAITCCIRSNTTNDSDHCDDSVVQGTIPFEARFFAVTIHQTSFVMMYCPHYISLASINEMVTEYSIHVCHCVAEHSSLEH